MQMKILRIALVTVAVLAIAYAFVYQYGLFAPRLGAGTAGGSGIVRIGGPFALVDQTGRTRRDTDFRGSLMLIFFGYTYCPDVCPTALQIMTAALESLGAKAANIQPILITTDPARDTVARLKDYAANFHPRLVALTGSAEAVARAAHGYRVYYATPKDHKPGHDYLMDHTSIIYLMARDGGYLTHFNHNTSAEAMARVIRKHL